MVVSRNVLTAVFAAAALAGCVRTVKVSDFGFDKEDSTKFIQAALDSGAERIVFDRRAEGPWVADRLRGRSNCEIVFEDGAELVAKRGAFKGIGDTLLTFECASNVTIRGRGCLRMWKGDYQKPPYKKAEWRHALALLACRNVLVEDMEFNESGGDGIYVSVTSKPAPGFRTYCENVTIRNVKCLRNNRQGISVIAVDGLLVENCDLSDTIGTSPESGIDFEPNVPQDPIVNCTVRNCRLERNHGHGVEIMLVTHDELTAPVSISVENCTVRDNTINPFCYNGIAPNGNFRTPSGLIGVKDCVIRKTGGTNESYSAKIEWSGATGLPPLVYPDAWDPAKAKVVDRAPGQLVKLNPTRCRRNAAYLFYAAKPGTVRLAAKQAVVGKGKPSEQPLVVSRFRGAKVTELAAPTAAGTSYSFEVPACGFYQIDWGKEKKEWGTSLVLTESDVPVAYSMFTDRNKRGLWMAPFMYGLPDVKMHFAVPEGSAAFAATVCGFGGGAGQSAHAVVRDPSGKVVYDCDNVGYTDAYRSEAHPAAGLWTIECHRPSNGQINNFGFDLAGLPPLFFLSDQKYWTSR